MSELIIGGNQTEQIDRFEDVKLGQWYWVDGTNLGRYCDDKLETGRVLRCVVETGSNYIEFDCPRYQSERVHLREFFDRCELELDPFKVIDGYIERHKTKIRQQMLLIKNAMDEARLSSADINPSAESRSLSVVNSTTSLTEYNQSLESIRDKLVPEAKEKIRRHSEKIESWLKSKMLGAESEMNYIDGALRKVKDRIFDFSIYAGLTEGIAHIRQGAPASIEDKLHVMQRLCYMDEECIANYLVGGIDCQSIKDFDKWIAKDENMDRLLPFPKCLVAFQVRRERKERYSNDFHTALVNIQLGDWDEWTFLYVRNGQNLYRVASEHEFGVQLFPDKSEFDLTEPLMAKSDFCDWRPERITFITVREFEQLQKDEAERVVKKRQWRKEEMKKVRLLPRKDRRHSQWCLDRRNPYREPIDLRYQPFDSSSVYYDDMVRCIGDKIKDYNRVTLLIQGLADRTRVLAPCPELKMWDARSVAENIKLIFDAAMVIHNGEPPSVERYILDRCRDIKKGTVVAGQRRYWKDKKLHEEDERAFEGAGPPEVMKVTNVTGGKATLVWTQKSVHHWGRNVQKKLRVPVEILLNVDRYAPGDFKQFFNDPRTRKDYLGWAHTLLLAEEYLAGNIDLDKELKECQGW